MWNKGKAGFKHWAGFDNYGVFIVEEGELSEEEILRLLKDRCDKEWNWKLVKLEEYRYLVKFPPYKRVESIILHTKEWRALALGRLLISI